MLKSLIRLLAIICISPLLVTFFLSSLIASKDSILESHSQLLSLLPGRIGSYLRVAFYRFTLEHCDPTATISFGTLFSKTNAQLHRHCYIGPRCMLGDVIISEDVLLGPAVQIPSGPHTHGIYDLDTPIRLQPGSRQTITINRDTWVGAGSIILADVAEQNVIAAGSIVTKPTEPQTINAGTPAKMIKAR